MSTKLTKEEIKEAAIKRLKEVINCIESKEWGRLIEILQWSPAGDDYGTDSIHIRFKDVCGCEDIGDVISNLIPKTSKYHFVNYWDFREVQLNLLGEIL